jgi:asparagine synthase (glutamine-hydrolysing)
LNERAREIAPVRMTGNYGGEVLRGVRAFKPVEPPEGLYSPAFLSEIRRASETYRDVLFQNPISFAAFQQVPWCLYGVLALEQTQLSMRSPYLDNDFVRTAFQSPKSALTSNAVSLRLIADGNQDLLGIPTDRGLAGNRGKIAQATSRSFLEFLFKAEYACDMGMPQWLARLDHDFSPLRLEHVFLGRHKTFHFRVWYRDALAKYVQETLLDPRSLTRSYIERKGLEALVRGHLIGNRNYTNELHKLLTLELIQQIFLESKPRSSVSRESLGRSDLRQLNNA